jgi:hypothetical protein
MAASASAAIHGMASFSIHCTSASSAASRNGALRNVATLHLPCDKTKAQAGRSAKLPRASSLALSLGKGTARLVCRHVPVNGRFERSILQRVSTVPKGYLL